jgi:hypothetical protein
MSSYVVTGESEATVETTGPNTFFGQTAAMVSFRQSPPPTREEFDKLCSLAGVAGLSASCIILFGGLMKHNKQPLLTLLQALPNLRRARPSLALTATPAITVSHTKPAPAWQAAAGAFFAAVAPFRLAAIAWDSARAATHWPALRSLAMASALATGPRAADRLGSLDGVCCDSAAVRELVATPGLAGLGLEVRLLASDEECFNLCREGYRAGTHWAYVGASPSVLNRAAAGIAAPGASDAARAGADVVALDASAAATAVEVGVAMGRGLAAAAEQRAAAAAHAAVLGLLLALVGPAGAAAPFTAIFLAGDGLRLQRVDWPAPVRAGPAPPLDPLCASDGRDQGFCHWEEAGVLAAAAREG